MGYSDYLIHPFRLINKKELKLKTIFVLHIFINKLVHTLAQRVQYTQVINFTAVRQGMIKAARYLFYVKLFYSYLHLVGYEWVPWPWVRLHLYLGNVFQDIRRQEWVNPTLWRHLYKTLSTAVHPIVWVSSFEDGKTIWTPASAHTPQSAMP